MLLNISCRWRIMLLLNITLVGGEECCSTGADRDFMESLLSIPNSTPHMI